MRAALGQPGRAERPARRAGQYTVTPADRWHVWGGYYENGTLIWRSRWVGDWRTECREALAMPADPHRVVLLRQIAAVDGAAKVDVFLVLRAGYGRSRMTGVVKHGDGWNGRSGSLRFRRTGAGRARHVDGGLALTVELAEGEEHDLVLEICDREFTVEPPEAGAMLGSDRRSLVAGGAELR